jgi:hypothetical protein
LARLRKIQDGANEARAQVCTKLQPLQFLPTLLPLFSLSAHTLIRAITLRSRFPSSNSRSESSPLTLFPLDSTFFPKTTQNHTQTDKNSIPSRWGESTHDLPSTPMRQHHGSIEINLNGLLANCSTCCSKEKMHINVVVIGHVDSGKSTTTGKPSQQPRSATRASCSHT